MSYEEGKEVIIEYNKIKTERDTLIDDIAVLRANNKRLERENEKLKRENRRKHYSANENNKYYKELWNRTEEYRIKAENAMEFAESENIKVLKLEHENKRLTRLTHKLTTHRTMWDQLKNWRRDMLEIDTNDTQLISLGLVMDDLERNWLYGEDK